MTNAEATAATEAARLRILARSTIELRTDKKGREFAQYYCMGAHRWIRTPTEEAKLILAGRPA